MVNIYDKKNNVPYYIVGSLATLALLASGVFAAAPAILTALPSLEFLAPVVTLALSLGTPLIAVCAVFSVVTIAFSAIAIKKNRTISEQGTQLTDKTKEIEAKDKTLSEQGTQLANKTEEIEAKNKTISEKDTQLTDKTKEIEAKDKTISEKGIQLAKKDREIDAKNKYIGNNVYMKIAGTNVPGKQIREARKAKKAAVEGDMYLESLFENISAGSAPNAQEGERFYDAKIGPDAQEGERFYDAKIGPDAQEDEKTVNGMEAQSAPNAQEGERFYDAKIGPDAQEDEKTVNGMEAQSEPVAQKDELFDNAKSGPKIQQTKSTKAVSQQKKSNRFSTNAKTLGALSVISAIISSGVLDYLFNQVSNGISFANNSTGVYNPDNLLNPSSIVGGIANFSESIIPPLYT